MTYPFSDCCPNLPGAGTEYSPCDDGYCCVHGECHQEEEDDEVPVSDQALPPSTGDDA